MRHADSCAHALPLNDRLFQEPFYVTHAGWERVSPHQTYPRPGHPSYYQFKWEEGRILGEFCLALITNGKGELQTKQGRQPLSAGDAFLYQPGEFRGRRNKDSEVTAGIRTGEYCAFRDQGRVSAFQWWGTINV